MAYSKADLSNSGNKASPCFRPFWIGKLSDVYLYGLYPAILQKFIIYFTEF
jgi:hypothetical protein